MPLRREVGLGPDDIVLDGDPAPPPQKNGGTSATFQPMYCGQMCVTDRPKESCVRWESTGAEGRCHGNQF